MPRSSTTRRQHDTLYIDGTVSLVAEWTFDEGTGQSVTDSSGNAQGAVLGGSLAVEASDPVWVSGR